MELRTRGSGIFQSARWEKKKKTLALDTSGGRLAYLNDGRFPKTGNPSRCRLETGNFFLAARRALRRFAKAEAAPGPRSPREHLPQRDDGGRMVMARGYLVDGGGEVH